MPNEGPIGPGPIPYVHIDIPPIPYVPDSQGQYLGPPAPPYVDGKYFILPINFLFSLVPGYQNSSYSLKFNREN